MAFIMYSGDRELRDSAPPTSEWFSSVKMHHCMTSHTFDRNVLPYFAKPFHPDQDDNNDGLVSLGIDSMRSLAISWVGHLLRKRLESIGTEAEVRYYMILSIILFLVIPCTCTCCIYNI